MSMWDYSTLFEKEDAYGSPRTGIWKYTKWADPFKNGVKHWEQIACEGEKLVDIEMWYPAVGHWWFTQFVPSPVELIRKNLLGQYRCGFYLGTKAKSPIDIIWRNGAGSRFLAKIAQVPVRTAFYAWGVQTLWEGLATWQSLIYKGYGCEGDDNSCITADGAANISIEGSSSGNMPFGVDVFDPNSWHTGFGGITIPLFNFNTDCRVYLSFTGSGASVENLTTTLVFYEGSTPHYMESHSGAIGNGEQDRFSLSGAAFSAGPGDWRVEMQWQNMQKDFALGRIELRMDRAVAHGYEDPPAEPCALWIPGNLSYEGFLQT